MASLINSEESAAVDTSSLSSTSTGETEEMDNIYHPVDPKDPVIDPIDPRDEIEHLKKENRRIQCELDEARSLVAVANYSSEESLETERRKCREEVATLQQLMKGLFINLKYNLKTSNFTIDLLNWQYLKTWTENVLEATRQAQERSEGEIRRLKNLVTRRELEAHEHRAMEKDNPNVFSAVTKTLARKVNNLANTSLSSSPTPAAAIG